MGSAGYVAGAEIGNGIGNAVRQNQIYNACMEAIGFVAIDQQAAPVPTPGTGYAGSGTGGLPEYETPPAETAVRQ